MQAFQDHLIKALVLRRFRDLSYARFRTSPISSIPVPAWRGCAPCPIKPRISFPLIQKVPGMLALFSNRRRVLVAFAILTGVLLVSLLVLFNIV